MRFDLIYQDLAPYKYCNYYYYYYYYLYLSVCLSLASDSLETVQVIIIQFGTVTIPQTWYHALIILTLTFIQGHTYYTKCSSISETVQAMPITIPVNIVVRLKVYIICS